METNNFDKLVKVVTENILEKIDIKTNQIINDKSCLVLVPNFSLGFKDYYSYIKKNYSDSELFIGTDIDFSRTQYTDLDPNLNFVRFDVSSTEFINILDQVKIIVVLGLKIHQMNSLSLPDDSDDINHVILSSVMANKSVEVMMNTNESIFGKISKVVSDIRDIGVKVTNLHQSTSTALDEVGLITESYVMNLKNSGISTITIDKKQLITPLAKDKLRESKIKIEYYEEAKL